MGFFLQNILQHSEDIYNRPKKEWIRTNKNKVDANSNEEPKRKQDPGLHRMSRKKRRRMEAKAYFKAANEDNAENAPKSKEKNAPIADVFSDDVKAKKKKSKTTKSERSTDFEEKVSTLAMKSETIGA